MSKKWSEIIRENEGKILDVMREEYRVVEGVMQGWHVDIEIDKKGNVWGTELFSDSSHSMSSWKGETKIVCSIRTWEVDVDVDAELKGYKGGKYQKEFENQEEYDSAEDFLLNVHPDILDEFKMDALLWMLDEYNPSEELEEAIRDIEREENEEC